MSGCGGSSELSGPPAHCERRAKQSGDPRAGSSPEGRRAPRGCPWLSSSRDSGAQPARPYPTPPVSLPALCAQGHRQGAGVPGPTWAGFPFTPVRGPTRAAESSPCVVGTWGPLGGVVGVWLQDGPLLPRHPRPGPQLLSVPSSRQQQAKRRRLGAGLSSLQDADPRRAPAAAPGDVPAAAQAPCPVSASLPSPWPWPGPAPPASAPGALSALPGGWGSSG